MLNIKEGKFCEEKIVNWFGTEKQKANYKVNQKLNAKQKNSILSRASRQCNIIQLARKSANGTPKYWIKKVYATPLPSNFTKMNSGLYQYIIPLMLMYIIKNHDQNNKASFTVVRWGKEINMVNRNYLPAKYNKRKLSNIIKVDECLLYRFYEKSDARLRYYITQSLNYLKQARCIIWNENYRLVEEWRDLDNKNDNLCIYNHKTDRIASDEDKKIYTEAIKYADEKADIQSAKERYYSYKSVDFQKYLIKYLKRHQILYVYKVYEAFYIDLDWCKFLLSFFSINEKNYLQKIHDFNKEFSDTLIEQVIEQYKKTPDKFQYYFSEEELTIDLERVTNMLISYDTKKVQLKDNQSKLLLVNVLETYEYK